MHQRRVEIGKKTSDAQVPSELLRVVVWDGVGKQVRL
jgi:hypothetical protein